MIDIIIILILGLGITAALAYIRREKKRGVKCIGCPYSGACHKKSCGCQSDTGGNIES